MKTGRCGISRAARFLTSSCCRTYLPVPVLPETPPLVLPVPEVDGLVVLPVVEELEPAAPVPVVLLPVPVELPALLFCWRRQSSFAMPVRPTQLVEEPDVLVLSLGLVVLELVLGLELDPAELLSLGLVVVLEPELGLVLMLGLALLPLLVVESLPAIARPVMPRNAAAMAAPRIFCFIFGSPCKGLGWTTPGTQARTVPARAGGGRRSDESPVALCSNCA